LKNGLLQLWWSTFTPLTCYIPIYEKSLATLNVLEEGREFCFLRILHSFTTKYKDCKVQKPHIWSLLYTKCKKDNWEIMVLHSFLSTINNSYSALLMNIKVKAKRKENPRQIKSSPEFHSFLIGRVIETWVLWVSPRVVWDTQNSMDY
jgi:hypothetical protein